MTDMHAAAGAAARNEGILDRLQQELDALPNALARIAKYILENPEKVLHQSVAELGEFSSSGEASIVRFCRHIGFSGFRAFKLALAAEVGRPRPTVQVANPDEAMRGLHETMLESLTFARDHVDMEAIERGAAALAASRRIDLYGAGLSGITAEMLAYRLLRTGLTALAFRNAYMAHEVANGLGAGCVAIGISISGLSEDTLQFLKGARAAGATTIAITNRPHSPIAETADLTLRAGGLHDRPIGGTLTVMTGNIFMIECLLLALDRSMAGPPAK
jgi:DNA-binding MurR/RpiR family transcriptional regulator